MSEDLQLAETFDNYSGIAVANLGIKAFESSATDNKYSVSKDGSDLAIVKCKDHPCLQMINEAKKKKVVFFPEIGRSKFFLSLTRSHKSNLHENIYFFFSETTHSQAKKIPLGNLFARIYVFSPFK